MMGRNRTNDMALAADDAPGFSQRIRAVPENTRKTP